MKLKKEKRKQHTREKRHNNQASRGKDNVMQDLRCEK